MAAVVLTVSVWARLPPTAGVHAHLEQLLVPAAVVYAAVAAVAVYRWPAIARHFPYGSLALDVLFVVAWVWASGGARGPFLPLLLVVAANAPLRLFLGPGLVLAVVAAAACRWLGGPAAWPMAGYTLLSAVTSAAWSTVMLKERHSALRDALTGAATRAHGLFLLRDLLKSRLPYLCIALLDLDGFKEVNDGGGHLAGDEVLARVVAIAHDLMRPQDVIARYGGDEFLIVWPRLRPEEAALRAERLRSAIENLTVQWSPDGLPLRVTASVGIASAYPGVNASRLVQVADQALYAAKRHRNRVVVAGVD